jgi:hypothetical protein
MTESKCVYVISHFVYHSNLLMELSRLPTQDICRRYIKRMYVSCMSSHKVNAVVTYLYLYYHMADER